MFPHTGRLRWMAGLHIPLMACVWLLPLVVHSDLPETIPVHFTLLGEADGYGGKAMIWWMPIIGTLLGAGFLVLLRYPQTYNHPRKDEVRDLPPARREPVNMVLREMMLGIALCVDVIMLTVIGMIVIGAREAHWSMNWMLFVSLVLTPLGVVVAYLIRISRAVDLAKRSAVITDN